eukprot:332546_1
MRHLSCVTLRSNITEEIRGNLYLLLQNKLVMILLLISLFITFDTRIIAEVCKHVPSQATICNDSDYDAYDITINAEWSYISQLDEGWQVCVSDAYQLDNVGKMHGCAGDDVESLCHDHVSTKTEEITDFSQVSSIPSNLDGVFVALSGAFNVGKTFLLNLLTGRNYPTGFDETGNTKGINAILPITEDVHLSKSIFVDTPGRSRSVAKDELKNRYMTDIFLEELITDIADVVIMMATILSVPDQVSIERMIDNIMKQDTGTTKTIIIVHNFRDIHNQHELDIAINQDIVVAFDAIQTQHYHYEQKFKLDMDSNTYYRIDHVVLCDDRTELGKKYNAKTVQKIKELISASPRARSDINILKEIKQHLTPLMRLFFQPPANTEIIKTDRPKEEGAVGTIVHWVQALMGVIEFASYNRNSRVPIIDTNTEVKGNIFQLTATKSNDLHCPALIHLVDKQKLEYYPSDSPWELPQSRPQIDCQTSTDEAAHVLVIQCSLHAPSTVLCSKANPCKDIMDGVHIGKQIIEGVYYLRVYGVIPPMEGALNAKYALEMERQDRLTHGFVARRFKLPLEAAVNWRSKDVMLEHGVLTVVFNLTDDDY